MNRLFLLILLMAVGCSSKQVVVVYSPHGKEMLGDYKKLFEAANPGVEVQALDMGSQDVYARVSAERGRPACDVWWGSTSSLFIQAAKEGLLAPYRPSWAEHVKAEYRDAEDLWYPTFLSALAIMFNTRGMTQADAPQTWDGLLDPKWKGKITLRKPLPSGTMRAFISAMIARAPSEDAGIAWLKQLHASTESYPESPNLLYDHIKKNEPLVSVWLQPDIVMQTQLNGYPFGFVVPPETMILTDGIALVKGAPHAELARKFYEFVTTREALIQQAKTYAKMPARDDIEASALPGWMHQQQLVSGKYDMQRISEMEKSWCARWQKEVYEAAKAP